MKKAIYVIFSIICVFTVIAFCVFNFVLYPEKYVNYVTLYSDEYNLDYPLVYAIIKTESNFNERAVSPSNAKGLMQLIPSTAKYIAEELDVSLNDESLFDPKINIRFGCYYLNYLFKKFNNIDVVVCAYNAGEGVVKNWIDKNGNLVLESITYPETKNYHRKVMSYYRIYKNKKIYV